MDRVGNTFGSAFFTRVTMLAASHARQMGSFALLYRLMQVLMHGTGLSYANPLMSFVPGFIGGAWIHGVKGPIPDQLNMYVMARAGMTLVRSFLSALSRFSHFYRMHFSRISRIFLAFLSYFSHFSLNCSRTSLSSSQVHSLAERMPALASTPIMGPYRESNKCSPPPARLLVLES